ncbi:MAG TPA: hypothetical protein VN324_06045 [Quisquiliibacterium sp.]|nr:hypothetical protein [Quisquiliibacterium sp.]
MNLLGFRTHAQLRRSRRDFAAKYPRIRTSEDRVARRRMDALAYVLFLCLVVIPGAVLIADMLTGLEYVGSAIAAVLQVAR